MSQKHVKLLTEIFKDPIATNINWREIESLLKHLGAETESLAGARIRARREIRACGFRTGRESFPARFFYLRPGHGAHRCPAAVPPGQDSHEVPT